METTLPATEVHPILGCVAELSAALSRVASSAPVFMSTAEKRAAVSALATTESRLQELRLRVLAAADTDEIGKDAGASSTAAYVARTTRQTRETVSSDVRLATALDERFEQTRAAMAVGALNTAQARAIVGCVDKLSDEVGAEDRLAAERHLVEQAQHFDAHALRRLGRRLFEVIDPDRADEEEGKALEREEARARATAMFSMRANGDGTSSGCFKLPDLHAAILRKALQTLTAPRRLGEGRLDETGRKVPYPRLLGQGLMELLEHLPVESLPAPGGSPVTVVVTVDLQALRTRLGAASLDDGTRISASEARRLACSAGIIPLVLGGDSQPLDIGRERRLFSRYQRIALATRYGGCCAEDCDRPPSWCEIDHHQAWEEGGRTDLENGRPYCAHHHRLKHDSGYAKTSLPSGQVRFRRRQ